MKQEYSVPELEIVPLQQRDIVRTSDTGGNVVDPNPGWWG